MTGDEKRAEYRRLVFELLDYMDACSRHARPPLMHDVNVYRARMTRVDKASRS